MFETRGFAAIRKGSDTGSTATDGCESSPQTRSFNANHFPSQRHIRAPSRRLLVGKNFPTVRYTKEEPVMCHSIVNSISTKFIVSSRDNRWKRFAVSALTAIVGRFRKILPRKSCSLSIFFRNGTRLSHVNG